MQLESHRPKSPRGDPLILWGQRLLLLSAFSLLGWLWWKNDSTPSKHPAKPESGARFPGLEKVLSATNRTASSPPSALRPPSSPPIVTSTATIGFPRPAENLLEAQVALTRFGFSPGPIDGAIGSQTRAALRAFQLHENLPATGQLDATTRAHLTLEHPAFYDYVIAENDEARLRPLGSSWLAKSQQDRLEFETLLELVAEKGAAHTSLVRALNPTLDFANLHRGMTVRIPLVEVVPPSEKAAWIRISLGTHTLEAFGSASNVLAHFPVSIAARVEKRPAGELHVAIVAPNPVYVFDPANFPDSPEAKQGVGKLVLKPGPNNPVGTVWIGLDKSGYGIHGTPKPEDVGRTGSLGCFRLANWNVEHLLKMVWIGLPVFVDP